MKRGERIKAELFDSKQMVHTVLDAIPVAVFWKDRNSIYLGGNRTWLETAGLNTSEEVIGKSDYDLPWEKEQAEFFRECDRRIMESGNPEYNMIEPYRRADGTDAWAKTNKVPLRDQEGHVIGILGTYEDITERKMAEKALNKERNLIRALMDNIPDNIYFKDIDSRFIEISRALAEKFRLSDPVQAVGKTDFDFFLEEHAKPAFEAEQTIIRTSQPMVGIEEKETWFDRPETWVSTTKMPLRDENGKIIGTFGISHDITERKKLANQITADLKEKETLLKEIHHRVKNNMQIISSLLNMLCRQISDTHIVAMINSVRSRIQSMALVHEMMYQYHDYSKIDMHNYISNLILVLNGIYHPDAKRIKIQIEGNTVYLNLDQAVPCGMIINELISNAMKHAFQDEREGMIKIKIDKISDKVQVSVSDNGISLPKMFKSKTTETMGMNIINDLVKQLDGSFKIKRKDHFKVFQVNFSLLEHVDIEE